MAFLSGITANGRPLSIMDEATKWVVAYAGADASGVGEHGQQTVRGVGHAVNFASGAADCSEIAVAIERERGALLVGGDDGAGVAVGISFNHGLLAIAIGDAD